MTEGHFDDDALLAYLDDNDARAPLTAVAQHLERCDTDCRERLEWLSGFVKLLRDKEVHRFATGSGGPLTEHVDEARSRATKRAGDDAAGWSALRRLKDLPTEPWFAHAGGQELPGTAGLVRRMIAEARGEFDRHPKDAIAILDVADRVASAINDALELAEHRGVIAKERAEALRMLGRHRDALDALDTSEEFLSKLPAPAYDLAFVHWVRAAVLFYLTRYDEALSFARRAASVLRAHGDIERASQVRMIEANILCEKGDVEGAHRIFTRLLLFFGRGENREMVARLNANLAECEVRLDRQDVAYEYAEDAQRIYEELGYATEKVRVRWILGYALLRYGDSDEALEELRAASAAFAEIGMHDAVAGVGLDIAELHLAREEWSEAESLARTLANDFAVAAAPLHAARAFAYLREAARARSATVALLDYLRSYLADIAAGDDGVRFTPPAS